MNDAADIDEADIARLVPLFYERVRADPELGPVFNEAVTDWPEHIERLIAFWSSVSNATRRYKGNPMSAHLKHRERMTPELFERWLALWARTAADVLPPPAAAAVQARAERIGQSLQLALFFKLEPHPRSVRAPV
ncbi:group III truncated hemoglobin [Brevundimonas lenta]|uniref:Hemoglobin n=1 Tax=Brevundimonas lenta TaxID=424796 RepID=A0A7W6JC49_9CAUL|nr:hemoglobin [Brevundimonas lenta]